MGIENLDFEKIVIALKDMIDKSFESTYNLEFVCDDFYHTMKNVVGPDFDLYGVLKILEDLKIIRHIGFVGPVDCPDMFIQFEYIYDL